jgi:hypothetical protein
MNEVAEIAMYHYYLTEEVLNNVPSTEHCDGVGDYFGAGQDCFVIELFAYSEVFYRVIEEAYQNGRESLGVAVYEIPERLANWFWEEVISQGNLEMEANYPNIDEFKLEVKKHI